MKNMFRIAGILLMLSWIFWTAAPVVAGLQDPASHCKTCKSGFCPMTKTPKPTCHASAATGECKMRAACDHSRDIAVISFDVLLPEFSSEYCEADQPFHWNESSSLAPIRTGIDPPPPRDFAS